MILFAGVRQRVLVTSVVVLAVVVVGAVLVVGGLGVVVFMICVQQSSNLDEQHRKFCSFEHWAKSQKQSSR